MTTSSTPPQRTPLTPTVNDVIETRNNHPATLHMRFPVDEETTRSLVLLTHEPVPLVRRLLRWWERRKSRLRIQP